MPNTPTCTYLPIPTPPHTLLLNRRQETLQRPSRRLNLRYTFQQAERRRQTRRGKFRDGGDGYRTVVGVGRATATATAAAEEVGEKTPGKYVQ
jgi:hypothetical protein